ncbi:MAG: OB-fold domain-containing protein [Actinomycetota bacterium]
MSASVAIDEALFTWPSDDPRLLGSRCTDCSTVTFPTQTGCPRCNSQAMETIELPNRGTLWTYTTQGFRPKGPPEGGYLGDDSDETFVPYALGYVEIPGHCKVESRLTGAALDEFRIGMDMGLVIVPFRKDDAGNDVMTFAFKPVSG